MTLTCKVCEKDKQTEEFPPDKRLKLGRKSTCKECHSKVALEWYYRVGKYKRQAKALVKSGVLKAA